MPTPETTSAEALEGYTGATCIRSGRGEAWREVKAAIFVQASSRKTDLVPAISEPLLMWVTSGEAETEDREVGGPWIKSRVKKGSFFLIAAGAPYDCRLKVLSKEPFEYVHVALALPIFQRAMEEVFGADASHAQLRDISGFLDETLNPLMIQLHAELTRRKASPLVVRALGDVIAVHLARNYTELAGKSQASASLPGFKLRQITDWMTEHAVEDFNLDQLAALSGLSKFHFHRLFKKATGVSPSHYHMDLRMKAARRLLRETKKTIIEVALDVGYSNPSHFAHLFRRETGLTPSNYRRQR